MLTSRAGGRRSAAGLRRRGAAQLALSVALMLNACGESPPPAEPEAAGAAASSSATAWAEVTSPRDATLLTVLGTVRGVGASAGAAVTSPFPGRVRALHAAPGDRVEVGAPLVDVDVPELAIAGAEVSGAAGEAEVHEDRLEVLRPLFEEGLVRVEQLHESERLLAEVNTRRRVAEAKLRSAGLDRAEAARAARRGYVTLTSPVAGTVLDVRARLGEATDVGSPLVRVAGEGEVRVEARLPRAYEGDARLRLSPGETVALRSLGPAVRDPESGLWVAFFAPVDGADGLRDGMRHPLELEADAGAGLLEVPTSALRVPEEEGAPGRAAEVMRRRGGRRAWVRVEVERVDGASALVRSAELMAGDAVAVDPAEVLGRAEEGGDAH